MLRALLRILGDLESEEGGYNIRLLEKFRKLAKRNQDHRSETSLAPVLPPPSYLGRCFWDTNTVHPTSQSSDVPFTGVQKINYNNINNRTKVQNKDMVKNVIEFHDFG